jgi:predicted  nucleic acid-binding Zn-ribbon protein
MVSLTLEKRVRALESQVAQLHEELQGVRAARAKDWRRTIGAFTDDEEMKALLRDAMRLREADRKKARSKTASRRNASR